MESKITSFIRKKRTDKGFSQEYIATQLNISQSSYARIESNYTDLTIERMIKILNILDVDLLSFFMELELLQHKKTEKVQVE